MTHAQGFEQEVFSQRNKRLVWDKLYEARNSTIRIWIVAKRTEMGGSYARQAKMKEEAHLLETLFIMHAKAAGHDLVNTAKMVAAERIAVEGLFGKRLRGRKSAGLVEIAQLLSMAPIT